ncbi:MAG: enoyl-CoA hydratase-related protein [Desulfosudaceae bacterium]
MTGTDELMVATSDRIGVLTLNRPHKRHALSPQLLVDIHLTLTRWAEEDFLRAVIIKGGDGPAFSSGYDVTAIPTEVSPEAAEILNKENPLTLCLSSVKHFPYPVIAMMNGYAFGAGLNLAVCCDLRIAADTIKVGMPPARLGLVYHPEGLKQFVQVLGFPVTREIFFTARTYDSEEALGAGLVNHLVPTENLEKVAFDYARQIVANAPQALKGMKEILGRLERATAFSSQDIARAETLIQKSFASKDLVEGQTAFLEKRLPLFTGE